MDQSVPQFLGFLKMVSVCSSQPCRPVRALGPHLGKEAEILIMILPSLPSPQPSFLYMNVTSVSTLAQPWESFLRSCLSCF